MISEVFATDTHKVLKFVLDDLLEFRCSYYLTNKSLKQCGEDVGLPKLDMDYRKKRFPGDPITEEEEGYCRRDVEIMIKKIRQLERQEGMDFQDFPLTNTGFLRNELRKLSKAVPGFRKWFTSSRMDADKYLLCRDAFQGGYTHANYLYVGEVVPGGDSFDYGSAYPFALLVHKYPVGAWHWLKNATWKDLSFMMRETSNLCFIGEFVFSGGVGLKVVSRLSNTYLSASRCYCSEDMIEDNGRVVSATTIQTVCTSLDLNIILKAYTVKEIKVIRLMWAKMDYLPDVIIKTMLKYYEQKQALKGIQGQEENYMKAKNRVNSFYGMFVTSILHDEITLNGTEWTKDYLNYEDKKAVNERLAEYYNSWNSFLPYQAGVFVPAWTRYHLWDFILKQDKNILYCDTDSAKVLNLEACREDVKHYNEWAEGIRKARLTQLGIDKDYPDLGIFDHETAKGSYKGFLTWGAKKYLILTHDNQYKMTVAGLSKKAVAYIEGFSDFQPGTIFGPDVSGRTISRFIDNPDNPWNDGGGCMIEDTTYRLSVSKAFEILLSGRDGVPLEEWQARNSDLYITTDKRIHVARPEVENDELDIEVIREKRNLYKVNLTKIEDMEE